MLGDIINKFKNTGEQRPTGTPRFIMGLNPDKLIEIS